MFPVNRVVALLTPVFAAGAAVGSAWLAKHFPGAPTPSSDQLLGLEISVATGAAGAALSWLKGHQAYEKRLDEGLVVARKAVAEVTAADPKLLGELKAVVEAEVAKALSNVSVKIGAPAAPTPPVAPHE